MTFPQTALLYDKQRGVADPVVHDPPGSRHHPRRRETLRLGSAVSWPKAGCTH